MWPTTWCANYFYIASTPQRRFVNWTKFAFSPHHLLFQIPTPDRTVAAAQPNLHHSIYPCYQNTDFRTQLSKQFSHPIQQYEPHVCLHQDEEFVANHGETVLSITAFGATLASHPPHCTVVHHICDKQRPFSSFPWRFIWRFFFKSPSSPVLPSPLYKRPHSMGTFNFQSLQIPNPYSSCLVTWVQRGKRCKS